MVIKIADFYFEIGEPPRSRFLKQCARYICALPPRVDAAVNVTEEDMRAERENALRYFGGEPRPAELFWSALYRKICAYALAHDAFLMHCAVIEYAGRGYAFSAPSGTGKTTHIRLWQRVFGEDNVTIVNGDKPILRVIDGIVYAYGTPWCGKEGYNANMRVPLCGLCFIERGEKNRIRHMPAEEAVPYLFRQIMVTDSTDLARQMELADILLEKVPCYSLCCNMEPEAAIVAKEGMTKGLTDGGL